jgi:peptide deformylase
MTTRTIVTPPDPVLRVRASRVRKFDAGLQRLIDDMIETMRGAQGVGLAATQVGEEKRVIVVEYREEDDPPEADKEPKPPKLYTLVNPEISRHSQETVTGKEACLSLPGYGGEVDRFEAITVKALNRHGDPVRIRAKGWLARIFQHEIDHLEGILYIDRATQVWRVEPEEASQVIPAD